MVSIARKGYCFKKIDDTIACCKAEVVSILEKISFILVKYVTCFVGELGIFFALNVANYLCHNFYLGFCCPTYDISSNDSIGRI